MSTEVVMLAHVRYRDTDGKPTCACSFSLGEVCEFYRTKKFGTFETCAISKRLILRRADENGNHLGTLVPGKWCPLWAGITVENQGELYRAF